MNIKALDKAAFAPNLGPEYRMVGLEFLLDLPDNDLNLNQLKLENLNQPAFAEATAGKQILTKL